MVIINIITGNSGQDSPDGPDFDSAPQNWWRLSIARDIGKGYQICLCRAPPGKMLASQPAQKPKLISSRY